MGEMIKGWPGGDAEPIFGPGAARRKSSSLLEGLKADPVSYTVFMVEDDTDARGQLLQTLQRSPFIHNVHWFNNGDAMLKHFVQEGYCSSRLFHNIPTIVLLDACLPGMGGFEVLKRLKENPLTSGIPVVMLSDDASEDMMAEAMRLKASGLISKPLALHRLHEVMQSGSSWPGVRS